MSKPTLPKGTRDFLPEQVRKRRYIFSTIEHVFKAYGYQPIETPVMESLATLKGKYGDEGDQLLFKVLNNGDYLAKADQEALTDRNSSKLTDSISKRGLRYDLTVPFARFVVMHQNDLDFPFKRYAIMPVWRADRPQKGRYQEFYQCDVDVVGSNSLMYEAELVKICDLVFTRLGISVTIKLNNRKVLLGIAETAGLADQFSLVTVIIDKLDKIGNDKVKEEMLVKGMSETAVDKVLSLIAIESLDDLEKEVRKSETGLKGIAELRAFEKYFSQLDSNNKVTYDFTLARGLSYYTGCIFEVSANDVKMGSVCGGGRYDDLTGSFGLKGVSGVGISFGAERLYDVMEELALFDKKELEPVKAIFLCFDQKANEYGFVQANKLREVGISIDVYPEAAKMKKQMKYVANRGIQYAIIIGDNEINSGQLTVKNMQDGSQQTMTIDQLKSVLA